MVTCFITPLWHQNRWSQHPRHHPQKSLPVHASGEHRRWRVWVGVVGLRAQSSNDALAVGTPSEVQETNKIKKMTRNSRTDTQITDRPTTDTTEVW